MSSDRAVCRIIGDPVKIHRSYLLLFRSQESGSADLRSCSRSKCGGQVRYSEAPHASLSNTCFLPFVSYVNIEYACTESRVYYFDDRSLLLGGYRSKGVHSKQYVQGYDFRLRLRSMWSIRNSRVRLLIVAAGEWMLRLFTLSTLNAFGKMFLFVMWTSWPWQGLSVLDLEDCLFMIIIMHASITTQTSHAQGAQTHSPWKHFRTGTAAFQKVYVLRSTASISIPF